MIPKPDDLTIDSEELRYVGWNIPKQCNKVEVGSIIALFCPELRYLMHTQQVIDQSFEKADNYMDENAELFADFSDPPVYSLSKESEHTDDMILVMSPSSGQADIYRLSAAESLDGEHLFIMTKLFKMRI